LRHVILYVKNSVEKREEEEKVLIYIFGLILPSLANKIK
jgi:hypothetical protein